MPQQEPEKETTATSSLWAAIIYASSYVAVMIILFFFLMNAPSLAYKIVDCIILGAISVLFLTLAMHSMAAAVKKTP